MNNYSKHHPFFTEYRLLNTAYRLLLTDYCLPVTEHRILELATSYQLPEYTPYVLHNLANCQLLTSHFSLHPFSLFGPLSLLSPCVF